jgi:uncharacterized delta-60 repeat protein
MRRSVPRAAAPASSPAHVQPLEPRRLLSAGDVDLGFSPTHRLGTNDVAVQQDGRILVTGNGRAPMTVQTFGWVVDRVNPNGSADSSYGTQGRAFLFAMAEPYAMARTPDGKTVVAGWVPGMGNGIDDIGVARVMPDGRPDTTISFNGGTILAPRQYAYAFDVAVQPDGKIIVAGKASNASSGFDSMLVRLLPNGQLDTSFSGDGYVFEDMGPDDSFTGVALDSAGRIVAAGADDVTGPADLVVARYTADGTPDYTFGTFGRARRSNAVRAAGGLAVDASDRVLVAAVDQALDRVTVSRFTAGGQLDTSFDGDGVAPAGEYVPHVAPGTANDLRAGFRAADLALAPDGKVVVSGTVTPPAAGGQTRMAAARLNRNGSYDTAFGQAGTALIAAFNGSEVNRAVAVQDDGRILLAGLQGTRPFSAGGRVVRLDGGVLDNAAITGLFWDDANGNGSRDASEIALDDWLLFLDANNNGLLDPGEEFTRTTTSQQPPNYRFDNLPAGTYTVRYVMKNGWQGSSPLTGSHSVTVASGQTISAVNFSVRQQFPGGALGGSVFDDFEWDGVRDAAEPGFPGRLVFLDANGNGLRDAGELGQLTDANGAYRFDGLRAGNYRIVTDTPAGYGATTSASRDVLLRPDQQSLNNHFGFTSTWGIGGDVWEDRDRDGTFDPDEAGLGDETVWLDLDNDGAVDAGEPTTVTNSAGGYRFTGLQPGTYVVRHVVRTGRLPVPDGDDHAHTVTLSDGQRAAARNFPVTLGVNITGNFFNDANGNGVWEGWENNLSGFTLFHDRDDDGVLDPGEESVVASEEGWGNLVLYPGEIVWRVLPREGWEATTPVRGAGTYNVPTSYAPTFGFRRVGGVLGRSVFYNNSAYDGYTPGADARDADAIATDKRALLPGQTATAANYTSYSRGINGIILDLPASALLTASDFAFDVGSGAAGSQWTAAPAPRSVTVTQSHTGIDRVTLIWPDGAIKNQWLRVTVKPTDNTRLSTPDVFYFGNLVGDTFDATAGAASVTTADAMRTRNATLGRRRVLITSLFDHNRDGRIDVRDYLLSRPGRSVLQMLTAPA